MKKLSGALRIVVGLLCLAGFSRASLILNEGESFTWAFEPEDFSFDRVWTEPAHHLYEAWEVDIDNIGADEIFSISIYENNLLETPFFTRVYTNSGSSAQMIASMGSTFDMKWADQQGIIKVAAISGSVGIMHAEAYTIANNEYLMAAVPEPSSIALILVGAGAILIRRNRFSKKSSDPT